MTPRLTNKALWDGLKAELKLPPEPAQPQGEFEVRLDFASDIATIDCLLAGLTPDPQH